MNEFSLLELLALVRKKFWIIAVSAAVCLAVALFYGIFIVKPVYSADATVLFASGVLFKDDGETKGNTEYITTGELSTTFALMKSFAGILAKSADYYDAALTLAEEKGLNGSYTSQTLAGITSINYDDDSIFITITVKTADKQDAVVLVSALAEAAPKCITDKLGRTSAVVLNTAETASDISINVFILCLGAAVIGIAISVMFIIMAERMDHTIKGEQEFLEEYDVPLLGVVPEFETFKKKRGI